MADRPTWREHPYRVLFPLGIALTWAGVFHWFAFAVGWTAQFRSIFHSIAQIQGFLMCFAAGFLLTMIPRRTRTAGPNAWQLGIAIVAPIATTIAAWFEEFAWSQAPWLILAGTLLGFAITRFRRSDPARRTPPVGFVHVPIALLEGVVGTLLIAAYGIFDLGFEWHQLGRLLLLQGMFLSLVIGVGGMVLPLMTRGDSSVDATDARPAELVGHLALAAALVASFVAEVAGHAQLALLARAALVLAALCCHAKLYRRPTLPGLHRKLIWLSAWAIPIGYAVAGAFGPGYVQAGLHIVFIAGFALMALAVGLHVTLAHGGRKELVARNPIAVPAMALCLAIAVSARAAANFDPVNLRLWIGIAAASLLLGTLCWLQVGWLATTPSQARV